MLDTVISLFMLTNRKLHAVLFQVQESAAVHYDLVRAHGSLLREIILIVGIPF